MLAVMPGRIRARLFREDGQVLVLAAVGMTAICAMAGFVIDVSSWYQTHRKQQAIADASALAAASDLPTSTATATADAQSYAAKNGGSSPTIAFSSTNMANDTVTVTSGTDSSSTFLKVLGINSAHISASATVVAQTLQSATGAAPFGVINTQPQLAGSGCPCFGAGNTTTLDETKTGPGGFGLIDIDGSRGGSGPGTLATWITTGCSCTQTAPVWLYSDPGAKFNSSQVKSAMDSEVGNTLLFPVYDQTSGNGANLQYHIIGWAGFHITGWSAQGTNALITGYFVHVDWGGSGTSSTATYFGATTSRLVG